MAPLLKSKGPPGRLGKRISNTWTLNQVSTNNKKKVQYSVSQRFKKHMHIQAHAPSRLLMGIPWAGLSENPVRRAVSKTNR